MHTFRVLVSSNAVAIRAEFRHRRPDIRVVQSWTGNRIRLVQTSARPSSSRSITPRAYIHSLNLDPSRQNKRTAREQQSMSIHEIHFSPRRVLCTPPRLRLGCVARLHPKRYCLAVYLAQVRDCRLAAFRTPRAPVPGMCPSCVSWEGRPRSALLRPAVCRGP